MPDSSIIIPSLLNGLTTGALYALVALGLTLIYGVLHIINFAHGALLMLGLYAVYYLKTRLGIDPYVALLIVPPAMFALGYVLQRGIISRAGHGRDENILLVTLGLSIIIENLALFFFRSDTRTIDTPYSFETVEILGAFLPLPKQPFEARRIEEASADSQSLVRFDTNSYSVPMKYAHRQVTVVATVEEVRLVYEDRLVARHPRCWRKEQYIFDPVHYLALLERKPGGFDHARPLENWQLPDCFALLRRRLEAEHGGPGTREFIRVLRLLELYRLPQLTDAVEYALDIDVIDPDSIRVVVEYRSQAPVELFSLDGRPKLARVRVEATDVSAYQSLLMEDR